MEDSCARKKVIVVTLNGRLFVGVTTTIEIPLRVLVLTDSLNQYNLYSTLLGVEDAISRTILPNNSLVILQNLPYEDRA